MIGEEEYSKTERLEIWKQNENRCEELIGKARRTQPMCRACVQELPLGGL